MGVRTGSGAGTRVLAGAGTGAGTSPKVAIGPPKPLSL